LVDAATSECRPDVVISFGQGRSAIDVETTASNMKNTSAVAGGVPDNRGIIEAGTPIAEGGPLEVHTSLPAQEIAQALFQAGFEADTSTDPGRYICNNIFYEVMHNLGGDIQAAGFIHLARDPHIDEQERQRLGQVVTIALRTTLDL